MMSRFEEHKEENRRQYEKMKAEKESRNLYIQYINSERMGMTKEKFLSLVQETKDIVDKEYLINKEENEYPKEVVKLFFEMVNSEKQ